MYMCVPLSVPCIDSQYPYKTVGCPNSQWKYRKWLQILTTWIHSFGFEILLLANANYIGLMVPFRTLKTSCQLHYPNFASAFHFAFYPFIEGFEVNHLGTPYDYESIMHYEPYAYAIDRSIPTIIPHWNVFIGNIEYMSFWDSTRVRLHYGCATWVRLPTMSSPIQL